METVKQFDIWVCNFVGAGALNDYGVRPCIVVSNNTCNEFSDKITVIPLTTSSKNPMPTHAIITSSRVCSVALCENVSCVYKDHLVNKVGELNEFERLNVAYCIKKQLGIE